MSESVSESGWYYLDHNGVRQGPFATEVMQNWYRSGFLLLTLLVRKGPTGSYAALSEAHEIIDSASASSEKSAAAAQSDVKADSEKNAEQGAQKTQKTENKQEERAEGNSDGGDGAASEAEADSEKDGKKRSFDEISQPEFPKGDASKWFYLDEHSNEQGPFSAENMKLWINAGYLRPTLKVRRGDTRSHIDLSIWPDFKEALASLPSTPRVAVTQSSNAVYENTPFANEYVQSANFSAKNLAFSSADGRFATFPTKGSSGDSALRQLSHYFDLEAYQEAKRAAKRNQDVNGKKVKWYRKKKKKVVYAWETDMTDH
jgi:hypothetical protein